MSDSPFSGESIPDLLHARVSASPDVEAYWHEAEGAWHPTTWRAFAEKVDRLAAGLFANGMTPGTHVGMLFPTSLEWEVAHHAVLKAGGVVVGLEPHDTAERLHWIIGHADVSILLVQNRKLFDRIAAHGALDLRLVVFVEDDGEVAPSAEARLEALMASDAGGWKLPAIPAQSPATIIYTSGTTGQPKGILYRHEQVVLAIHAITEAYPSIAVGSRFVCWLPLSNLFQRIMNLAAMHVGGTVYLVANPLDVLKALPVAKPDIFIGVPRFYEKLYDGMQKEIERKPAPVRWLIRKSIDLALEVSRVRRDGGKVPAAKARALRLADRVVLAKLRSVMGGRIQFMVTGSAPTPMRLLEFFHAIGLPLYEAYGMSENVVPMALNRPGAASLGSVGKPLDVNELRVSDEGELLVRGPGVFSGYYREERRPALDDDSFYRTGDYAAFDDHGLIFLRGRKSEIIKTSTGRRIAPRPVEETLCAVEGVERAMVIGNGRKCLAAIVSLDEAHRPIPRSLESDDLSARLEEAILSLPEPQRPGGFLIVNRSFSIDKGELTPNLKLRRAAIETGLAPSIERLYARIEAAPNGPVVVLYAGQSSMK